MAAKAVYASCVLAIYVTRDELDRLMRGDELDVPLFVGETKIAAPGASVCLWSGVIESLAPIYATDLAIYNSVPRKPSGVPKNSLYPKKGRV